MVAKSTQKPQIKWLIDLHGLLDALSSGSNAKATILDAIKSGEIKVLHSAGDELKNLYPDLWPDLSGVKTQKYSKPLKADHELAAHLQQMYGSSILGGIPSYDHFLAIAMCSRLKCRLVTSGNALKRSNEICKKTTISKETVATLNDV